MPTPMSPGTYLRFRREAAGMSIDDLALMTETEPHVCAIRRGDYLRAIEDGTMKIGAGVTLQLSPFAASQRFPFDPRILAELAAIDAGGAIDAPRLCRRCACSWDDACADAAGAACAWSAEDASLCTACIVADAATSFAAPAAPCDLPQRDAA